MTVGELGAFSWQGHRLSYEVRGKGPRTFVLLHGLLLPSGVNGTIATLLAERGHRVVLLDLLGHGRSDKPTHATDHRMEYAADQVVGLLDHLGVDRAAVGGTSLGANVGLWTAVRHPDRVQGVVCEMPVLERGTIGVMITLFPMLLVLRYAGGPARAFFRAVRRLPRPANELVEAIFETGGEPREMAAVLHGYTSSPVCPTLSDRQKITAPVVVIGHRHDWIHPWDDAAALIDELPDARLVPARSFFELRTNPERLVGEISDFLDEVWAVRRTKAKQSG